MRLEVESITLHEFNQRVETAVARAIAPLLDELQTLRGSNGVCSHKEIAQRLEVAPSTVKRWIKEGGLPASRLGHNFYIEKSDLEEWLMRDRVAA